MTLDIDRAEFENLEKDLRKAVKKYPDKVDEKLKVVGKGFKKAAIAKTPSSNKSHKYKLKKKYRVKLVGSGLDTMVVVSNNAPHFNLVENGHNMVTKSRETVGFVAGKHMMQRTKNEYETILPQELEKMVDELLRESNLS